MFQLVQLKMDDSIIKSVWVVIVLSIQKMESKQKELFLHGATIIDDTFTTALVHGRNLRVRSCPWPLSVHRPQPLVIRRHRWSRQQQLEEAATGNALKLGDLQLSSVSTRLFFFFIYSAQSYRHVNRLNHTRIYLLNYIRSQFACVFGHLFFSEILCRFRYCRASSVGNRRCCRCRCRAPKPQLLRLLPAARLCLTIYYFFLPL